MMRRYHLAICVATAVILQAPARAADALQFGPPPTWVLPAQAGAAPTKAPDAPIAVLLHDQQTLLEPGKVTTFTESAIRIQTPQGLGVGNISIPWDPARQSVTVNKLHIRRGDTLIDVLESGQKFTTIRRESNLEAATLDGQLTANIQPEGLQVGDVIELATTVVHSDPVLKGHVEAVYGGWNAPLGSARARLIWPREVRLQLRQSDSLPKARTTTSDGRNVLELSLTDVEPIIPPKGAPLRFTLGRLGQASDFRDWASVAELMLPLYRQAAAIPASGPLRDELERIRNETRDPVARAEKALALVQDRVRYVALLMGTGGYVPADAETTWSRRFGDCKAKTALLLALLRELGIDAEPVLVHSTAGDALNDRLPMLSLFDHVLVRARIANKIYWLDGTRTGDTKLARIAVPNFGWGLPIIAKAQLVPIVPPPLDKPDLLTTLTIDATEGAYAPAKISGEQVFRGDGGHAINLMYQNLSSAQLDQAMREYWRKTLKFVEIEEAGHTYDKQEGELRLYMNGKGKLPWDGGWFYVPFSSIAFAPDLSRADGPAREAPFAVEYPSYGATRIEIKLPENFVRNQPKVPAPVKETLAGTEYARTASLNGNVLIVEASERAVLPEISHKEATAAAARLKALSDDDVYLRIPTAYRPTAEDVESLRASEPASASAYFRRGLVFLESGKLDEAIADFSEAAILDPRDAWPLANRGVAKVWKQDHAGAKEDFAAAEAIDPENAVLWRGRGLMAEMQGEHTAAVEAFSRSIAQEPTNSFALARRATAFRALGDDEKALADSERALKLGYKSADLRLLRANIFRARGDREAAIREADLASQENPGADYPQVAAARIYAVFGLREKAMEAFDRALKSAPAAYIYLNRAQVRPSSDHEGRLADLDAALKLEPENTDALALKAWMLGIQQKYAEAIELYDRVLKDASSELIHAEVDRAVLLHKAGRTTDADSAFAAIRTKSKAAVEFNNLCWAKATAGILLDSALDDCRQALKMAPESGPYLDSLGMVMLKLRRLDEALEAYDKAVAKNTGSASLMGRAFVHAQKGDRAKAELDRAAALKLDPDAESRFAEYGLVF